MKKILSITLLSFMLTLTGAFAQNAETKVIKDSSINWTGTKVTGKHSGNINLQEGHLIMDGAELVGGSITIDMTSIIVLDLKGDSKASLERHLKSDDFFGVANHPTANLVISSAKRNGGLYTVTGTITIKGVSEPITFDLGIKEQIATASLTINRTLFGIRYGSGSFFDNLGDKAISDDFEINAKLVM